jgi:hypothetical protein
MAARQLCNRLISSHLGATPLWEDVYGCGAAAARLWSGHIRPSGCMRSYFRVMIGRPIAML